jgi:hypothetical protein
VKQASTRRLVAAALALLAAGTVHARNDRLLLPIAEALHYQGPGPALMSLPLQFGREAGVAADAQGLVDVRGVAVPYASVSNQYGNSRVYKSDPEVCREAFRKALGELQYRAQAVAGKAVVDIVSHYNKRIEFNSKDTYECHAGNTRAVVDLRGRISMADVPPSALTAPLPGAPAR